MELMAATMVDLVKVVQVCKNILNISFEYNTTYTLSLQKFAITEFKSCGVLTVLYPVIFCNTSISMIDRLSFVYWWTW